MYVLHYAPDNASLIIRILLEELGVPYEIRLVDRSRNAQKPAAYRRLNPAGRIPACEIGGKVMFETAAIGLHLAERYGKLMPKPGDEGREDALKWLFYLSNTLHADLRQFFYPQFYVGEDMEVQALSRRYTWERLREGFGLLEAAYERRVGAPPWFLGTAPSLIDIYLAVCCRWAQLYPLEAQERLKPVDYPRIQAVAAALEGRAAVRAACHAEGIRGAFFTAPEYPDPPEGVAL